MATSFRRSLVTALVVARPMTEGGALSAAGWGGGKKRVACPTCERPIQLKRSGWGYCRHCERKFDGRKLKSIDG